MLPYFLIEVINKNDTIGITLADRIIICQLLQWVAIRNVGIINFQAIISVDKVKEIFGFNFL